MSGMQVPAFLANRTAGLVAPRAAAGIQGAQPPRISIAANKFTLIDAAGNERPYTALLRNPDGTPVRDQMGNVFRQPSQELEIVIVDANEHVSKVFYAGAYSPGSNDAPTCWSDNGVGPSVSASTPQNSVCATCPHNAWGSAISNVSQKQTKACSDSKKIAAIVVDDESGIAYQLRIPPASLKNFKAMIQVVTSSSIGPRNADPSDVVCKVTFDGQGILVFTAVRFIGETEFARIEALAQDQQKLDQLVGRGDTPRPAISGSPVVAQIAAPQQQFVQPAAVVASPPVQSPAPTAFAPQNQGAGAFAQPVAQPMQAPQQPANFGQFQAAQPQHYPGNAIGAPQAPLAAQEPAKRTRAPRQPKAAAPAQAAPVAPQQPFQPAQQNPPAQAFVPPSANAPAFAQPAAQPPAASPQAAGQSFGIVQGAPEPDAALMASINAALGKG